FYSAAIRRAELAGLNLYDLNVEAETLRVLGKGRKERTVPVGDTALYWILKYIREVRPESAKESTLFLDLVCQRRLSPVSITNLVYEYAKQSKLKKKITPHTFRHSCAAHLLKNGADIRYIQELLGHASVATTQIYTKVVIKDLKKIYQNTHPRARR
ncbi:MAG: tyrosine-type recombinase/integrase, partial [Methanosarcinaceae archaeon]